jgi:hypothetical protein
MDWVSAIGVRDTRGGVRKDLPTRNTGHDTLIPVQPSPRLRPGKPYYATRNPGAGEDFTDLAAAVQLRLRVAVSFQTAIIADGHTRVANFDSEAPALTWTEVLAHRKVCKSGATQQFLPTWLSSDRCLRTATALRARIGGTQVLSPSAPFCIRGEITFILRFERRVCRWESCRVHQFHLRFMISDFKRRVVCLEQQRGRSQKP